MSQQLVARPLTYSVDSAELFERIIDLPGAVFLDSGRPGGNNRFDILAAQPVVIISSRGQATQIKSDTETKTLSGENPLKIVRQYLEPLDIIRPYPFLTGAIGYFSYDLGRQLETIPSLAKDDLCLPEMWVGIYNWSVVVDHVMQRTVLISWGDDQQQGTDLDEISTRLTTPASHKGMSSFEVVGAITSNMTKAEYFAKYQQVMDYIQAGDCYQVNLAQRFSVPVSGSPWLAYRRLRRINAAPFSAYLDAGDFQILSISPERFLQVQNQHVQTRPIKGTRPRRATDELDSQEKIALKESKKDRAENLMIVDLLRNDLSKNCRLGSVRVSRLFDIESYANVHHLVSVVEGDLDQNKTALDLLAGCFPGGSITGAPKLRAMEIIEELEPDRRSIYCGAIGYISRHGDMDMNIAIRTAVCHQGQFVFYGGGGLVADSSAEMEYQETLDKVSSIFELLKTSVVDELGA